MVDKIDQEDLWQRFRVDVRGSGSVNFEAKRNIGPPCQDFVLNSKDLLDTGTEGRFFASDNRCNMGP